MTSGAAVVIVAAMPTYEYRCNACQREFEYQQRMSDPDLVKCEACGEDRLEKLISWTSVGSSNQGLYSKNPKEAYRTGPRGGPPKKQVASTPAASTPAASTPAASAASVGASAAGADDAGASDDAGSGKTK